MNYYDKCVLELDNLRNADVVTTIAIESSCDETAVAILKNREVVVDLISSQIETHKKFGGVVPEIASRKHAEAIDNLVKAALAEAGLTFADIDIVAVTYGAGLLGALLVGVSYAKALAYALDKPLIAVDHVRGHIAANTIIHPDIAKPYVSLLCSGGHTEIVRVTEQGEETIGKTRDDAVGEAFDKVARVIGLPYPGGPEIEKAAKGIVPTIEFSRPLKDEPGYDFSYSGLKTQVINYVRNREQKGIVVDRGGVAAAFQRMAVSMLVDNTIRACVDSGISTVSAGGGVCANGYLREELAKACAARGITLYLPDKRLCTDNAAMIGARAYAMVREGASPASLALDAEPNL